MADAIGLDHTVEKSDKFIESHVGEETILMDLDEGSFSSVSATGLAIWSKLEKPTKVSALCDDLQSEFDVSPDVCRAETLGFLNELLQRGLIKSQS